MEDEPKNGSHVSAERARELGASWDATLADALTKIGAQSEAGEHLAYALERATAARLEVKAKEARFVVLSSIAGGGKSTIGAMFRDMGFERLPRVTTRAPRPGERDGYDYEFMTREAFEAAKENGEFAYAKETYGEGRAIRTATIEKALAGEKRYFVEGDALAYHAIRQNKPEYANLSYISIFLIPDSFSTALTRLSGRIRDDISKGADPVVAVADVEERVEKGIHYLAESGAHMRDGIYDGYLVNDDLARVRERLNTLFGV